MPRIRNEEPFDVEICFILTLPIVKPIENIVNVSNWENIGSNAKIVTRLVM